MKKRMSDRHRRNLELLHQKHINMALMYAAGAFTALLLGGFASFQKPDTGPLILFVAIVVNVMFLIAAAHDFLFVAKIEKALGVKETVVKYLESKKKASTK